LAFVLAAVSDVLLSAHLSWDVSLALSLGACLVLPLRFRHPWPVLLVTFVALLTGYSIIAAMIAIMQVAYVRRDRREVAAAVGLVALAYTIPWPVSDLDTTSGTSLASYLIYGLLVGGGPAALGMLIRTREELALKIGQLKASQDEEKRLHAERALSEDRARLAREMHDLVSHKVMLISVQAGGLEASGQAVEETAATIRTLAGDTLQELRYMVGVLRGPAGSHVAVAPGTLLADIERLVADSGLSCRLHLDVADPLPCPEVQHAAYRIVQEALTNVAKHAPGAPTAVLVARTRDVIIVEVHNGPATEAVARRKASGGYGLVGLRERAAELGGTLHASPLGSGFAVRAELPSGVRDDALVSGH
jgi:signal transduction histidine kinase